MKVGQCVYCGEQKELTKDHVPPKCLFNKPKPNTLVTVPCCNDCNKDAQKDDEYFRNAIVMREDVFQNLEAKIAYQKVIASFINPEQLLFKNYFYKSIERKVVYSNLGLNLGTKYLFNADLKRINNVIRRITKGLFYHHKKTRLSNNNMIFAFNQTELKNIYNNKDNDEIISFFEKFKKYPFSQEIDIGKNIFKYRYLLFNDSNSVSAWLFMFYNTFFALSFTIEV